ncbi:glucokinase [Reticulibacter mediterranei]|uniref:Glucokinase n=1 Tax=Reticulibacter mediterranei TaxID=2778369 RepID=A0A8J3N2S9_9CHLR|nr:ROK family protein [Reticulibacter mediterranei]GHO96414.1 glucokinase [Reticulibacter mediterranei]
MEKRIDSRQEESHLPAVLAFDIGGTRIKAGIVQGSVVSNLTIEALAGREGTSDVLSQIVQIGKRLIARREVVAVGMSVKGIIDPQRGVILSVNEALASSVGVPIAERLTREFGVPIRLENDARMYTLGELLYGAGRTATNMVCLTLGTGVGCGVALGRRILRGPHGLSGILGGHITVQVDGPRCTCGNVGCLEALIGTGALIHEVTEALASGQHSILSEIPISSLLPQHIFAASTAGDVLAQEIVQRFTQRLGAGVVSLVHAHDPDLVVLGGGMAAAAEQFLPEVQAYVHRHTWTLPGVNVRITTSELREAAALSGVAAYARGLDIFL